MNSLFPEPTEGEGAVVLTGYDRDMAVDRIIAQHHTQSVPSGKSVYVAYGAAVVVWSIPGNKNLGRFLLGDSDNNVWELSRLLVVKGGDATPAINAAIEVIRKLENPDAVVGFADPNYGETGDVYRAAGWKYHGQSLESRCYRGPDGKVHPRRKFHSGERNMTKAEIEALGFVELNRAGKHRFVFPISDSAKLKLGVLSA